MTVEATVLNIIRTLQQRNQRSADGITRDSRLYADGLGLDSLGAAELSTSLEMEFDSDPYSEGLIPQTVGEIVQFYEQT